MGASFYLRIMEGERDRLFVDFIVEEKGDIRRGGWDVWAWHPD